MDRDDVVALDAGDPLASYRDDFVIADGLLYLDGNSLGRLPLRTIAAIGQTVEHEWGQGLVRSWQTDWMELPTSVGDRLGELIGADRGQVLISDQTSVNLYKLATAALDQTGRRDIVSDASNFPSDLYILEGIAGSRGGRLRLLPEGATTAPRDLAGALDATVGLVSLSHVDYRSSTVADMAGLNAAARDVGALTLWDLSHSAGVLPVQLDATGADLAVGCTYKYLNGGPGAPGFLFVSAPLQKKLRQPIHGWFGHEDQFAFETRYRPALDLRRFSVGTPPIVSLRGAEAGIDLAAEAGIDRIRAKSIALTGLLIDRFDAVLGGLGFALRSPRKSEHRGGHVGITHGSAWQIAQALVDREVIPDFRAPDVIRLGPSPLYTRFVDVWDAAEIIADVVNRDSYRSYPENRDPVT